MALRIFTLPVSVIRPLKSRSPLTPFPMSRSSAGRIIADDFQEIQFGGTTALGMTEATAPLAGRYTLVLPAPDGYGDAPGRWIRGWTSNAQRRRPFRGDRGRRAYTLRRNPAAPRRIDLVLCEGGSGIPGSGLGRTRAFMLLPMRQTTATGSFIGWWRRARRAITRRDLNRIFSRWDRGFARRRAAATACPTRHRRPAPQ